MRNRDGHLVHANIHTDLVIAQEPLDPSCTHKPAEVYRVIEDFCLGRRRLELFGDIANVRDGWVRLFPWDMTLSRVEHWSLEELEWPFLIYTYPVGFDSLP